MKDGTFVSTPYGDGIIRDFRGADGVYEIELPFGTFYGHVAQQQQPRTGGESTSTDLTQDAAPESITASVNKINTIDLNVTYESLEKMRRLNLELACEDRNIGFDEAVLQSCSQCLLERPSSPKSKSSDAVDERPGASSKRFPRIRKFLDVPKKQVQAASQHLMIRKTPKNCLICNAPTCSKHASSAFAKENITLCQPCEHLFSIEYVVECLTAPSPQDRLYLMDRMMDIYDRALLLLRYSSQYVPATATALEDSMIKTNRVNVGSSGAGVVSGVLGVCAAATILTPVGPPLLVASLLFGGSATAVQTSTDLRNYYSEPNQLADRVIALHGMVRSILRIVKALHEVITRDHLHSGMYDEDDDDDGKDGVAACHKSMLEHDKSFESRAMVGMTAGRAAAASVEFASLAGATAGTSMTAVAETAALNAGLLNRSGMVLLRTARVARFAGGALSAATVMLEAKSLNDTLGRIRAGNACEKATILRKIEKEMDRFPATNELSAEIERYLGFIARRRRNMSENEALEALREYELQKGMDNSLLLMTEEAEPEDVECCDHDSDILSANPCSVLTDRAVPARDHGNALNVQPHKMRKEAEQHTAPTAEGFHRSNWGRAAQSAVVGASTDLVTSFRGGILSLKSQTDKVLNKLSTESETGRTASCSLVKGTPMGPVRVVYGEHGADQSFDESLTA
ncbi:hypothetical protein MPSEU_000173900 [Mayamaea pseudoterrestris]|nr:hypothetical protein MPSEU_000173900 [Mayamaea pseudoterrestris]